jgi:hypothetical protein
MFFKSRYLETENERLRKENHMLLSCLLERSGHREAANMLRGSELPPAMTEEQVKRLAKAKTEAIHPLRSGFRSLKAQLSARTMPTQAKDSADKLNERVEEQIHANA